MMPWLRLDDNAAEDPAVEGLTDKAFRAFIEGMLYCSRNLTDGQITATAAKRRGWSGAARINRASTGPSA